MSLLASLLAKRLNHADKQTPRTLSARLLPKILLPQQKIEQTLQKHPTTPGKQRAERIPKAPLKGGPGILATALTAATLALVTANAASNGTPKRAPSRARKRGSQGKRRGPDPGITDELTARICVAIVVGASLEAAAAANGVPETTFFRWLQMGRAEDAIPVYRDFAQQIAEALGRSELEKVAMVEKAARKEWTAAAWILERRWPQRYGRRTRVDGQLQVQAIVATPEWAGLRDRMLEALRPFPEALDAVLAALAALSGPEEIEGEAVEDGARELAR